MKDLNVIKKTVMALIKKADTLESIEEIRIQYLSKKGEISLLMGELRHLSNEEKPVFGALINTLKQEVGLALANKKEVIEDRQLNVLLEQEKIDVTLPGYQLYTGSIHPLNQVIEDLEDFFIGMGYQVAEGPEVEHERYNF